MKIFLAFLCFLTFPFLCFADDISQNVPSVPPVLLESQFEKSMHEREKMSIQREMEMYQAKVQLENAKKEYMKVASEGSLEAPKVIAVYNDGKKRALIREETGVQRAVAIGDVVGKNMIVQEIDSSGVYVSYAKKRIRLEPYKDEDSPQNIFIPSLPPGMSGAGPSLLPGTSGAGPSLPPGMPPSAPAGSFTGR